MFLHERLGGCVRGGFILLILMGICGVQIWASPLFAGAGDRPPGDLQVEQGFEQFQYGHFV